MTQLQVRKPPFNIDSTVPFQWQPNNPVFGIFADVFTFVAIAFERYIVAGARQAQKEIHHPAVAAETQAFLRQEAQHARAHFHHAKALIAQYPGLADTLAEANAAYDELLATRDLNFHLAYFADLEATFTPLFKMMLDNRGGLFNDGDERVGTIFLWHFVEEIEHRSSALLLYRTMTDDKWYRLRVAPQVFRHVIGVYNIVLNGFQQHVPLWDSQVAVKAASPGRLFTPDLKALLPWPRRREHAVPTMLGHVPRRDLRKMLWRLALSQLPSHDPADEPLPDWVHDWHKAFNIDEANVTTYAGVGL